MIAREYYIAPILGILLGIMAGTWLKPEPQAARAGLIPGDDLAAHVGKYTYGGGCTGEIDPINVAWVKGALWSDVTYHAAHHGGWIFADGSDQYFIDHGRCQLQHAQAASNFSPQPRFHVRIRTGTTDPDGQVADVDPVWGVFSVGDAHHEDLDPLCGHAIDAQSETGGTGLFVWQGGFNRGRADILENWWANGDHVWEPDSHSQWWGNTLPRIQCNGKVAWSDGYVYFLSNLWRDADGDGIQNEIDNCAGSYNPDQLNTDAAPIVSPGLPQATDITVPRGDLLGDVCDTDDDNDDIADIFEISGCGVSGPLSELNGDTDYDRVRDRAECDLGTNPADSRSRPSQTQPNDSDHDGLPDALEIALGSDPNNVRTLPRGILDSYLYKGYSLNPSIADNDGDGCPDNIEIASLDGDKILSSGDQGLLAYAIAHHLNLPNPDLTKDLTVNSGDQGQWAAIKASFGDSPARC